MLNVAETDVDAVDVERDVDEALVGRVADVVGAEPEDSSGGGVVNSKPAGTQQISRLAFLAR